MDGKRLFAFEFPLALTFTLTILLTAFLLALTFARPLFDRPAATAPLSLGIVAVDTSFSMAGRDREAATRTLAQLIDEIAVLAE